MRQTLAALVAFSMTGPFARAQTTPTTPNQALPPAETVPSDSSAHETKGVQGKVRDLDRQKKTVTLEDGTKLILPEAIQITSGTLRKGAMVFAMYEEKDGQKVVTTILVQPPPKF
jgi:NADH dehydrogenase FAD-containing subunit